MPTPQELLADPKFQALPEQERVKVLLRVDPNFGGLPPDQQLRVVAPRTQPAPAPASPQAAREPWSGESYLAPVRGALKRGGETLATVGTLLDPATYTTAIMHGEAPDIKSRVAVIKAAAGLGRKGRGEEVGAGAEQLAEFLLPGPSKGTLPLRMAKEAAIGGGITALQNKELGPRELGAAAVSAAFPGAGALLTKLTKGGRTLIKSTLRPNLSQFAHGADPVKGVLDEGIMAGSQEGLAAKTAAKASELQEAQATALAANPNGNAPIIPRKEILQPLYDSARDAIDSAALTPQEKAKVARKINGLVTTIWQTMPTKITPAAALELRKEYQQAINWVAKNNVRQWEKDAKVAVYHKINEMLDQVVPEVRQFDARLHNVIPAKEAARAESLVGSKDTREAWYIARRLAQMAAGAGVGTLLHGGSGGMIGAAAAPALFSALESVPVKTVAAQLLKPERVKAVAEKLARLSAAGVSATGPGDSVEAGLEAAPETEAEAEQRRRNQRR